MEFDNAFEVPLPVDDAWKVLMDIRRIAPCMPGAELSEMVDERTYKGRIGVRLGPVALSFAGTVKFEDIDNASRSARVAAQGSDTKGRGAANAVAAFRLEPVDGGSRVLVHTNLTLSGAVAQYGRGVGIIQMTAAQIITQFANNLKAQLATDGAAAAARHEGGAASPAAARHEAGAGAASPVASVAPPPAGGEGGAPAGVTPAPAPAVPPPQPPAGRAAAKPAAKPISGLALAAAVLWQALKRLFGRG
jgi:carbon monoxide dehydrogenase subunit G